MKILVLGDFHGEFPRKFNKIIDKEKVEILVSLGDFFPFHQRNLVFKYSYISKKPLWEFIGKNKYKDIMKKEIYEGKRLFKKLNKLKIPVITTVGNLDYSRVFDVFDYHNQEWKWDEQDFFSKTLKSFPKIKRFDYSFFRYKDFIFIGGGGHSFPGRVKSKNYKKYRKILEKLFKRFNKENKKKRVIFISHNVPYNTKLDLIGKKAHEKARGKHYGSKLIRRIIDKYQPIIHVGGHIHESMGKQKIGRTLCINPGAAHDGHGVILDLSESSLKIKMV